MNNLRKYAGVTLLEIILVLSVATMIMVLSIKYYQSASDSRMANAVLAQVSEITNAADRLAASSGSYTTANVSSTTLAPLLPANVFTTPWGTPIILSAPDDTSLSITITSPPQGACAKLLTAFSANNHFAFLSDNNPATSCRQTMAVGSGNSPNSSSPPIELKYTRNP